jgi:hypothetical protein
MEDDLGLGPEALVRLDDSWEHIHPAGRPGAKDEPALGPIPQPGDGAFRLVLGVENRHCGSVEDLSSLGQPELRPAPFEQSNSQLLLQGLELEADRRLAEQQIRRRRRDTPPLGDRIENPEVMQVHLRELTGARRLILNLGGWLSEERNANK